jgi:hypothetical protein
MLRDKGYLSMNDKKSGFRFIVATTGYDNLLERAFQELNHAFHVVSYVTDGTKSGSFYHAKYVGSEVVSRLTSITDPDNFGPLSDDANPVILRLPGAVESIDQRFAIIEDHFCDYLTYKDFDGLLPSELKARLKTSHQLFLGTRLRDWHLRALLYRIWEGRKPTNKSWAIHPEAEAFEVPFWKAANIDLIQFDFAQYIAGLRDRIERAPKK